MDFAKDYRSGFEFLTELMKSIPCLKGWEVKEYLLPDGSIQRWFVGQGEYLKISYKRSP